MSEINTVNVALGSRSYDIIIGAGLLPNAYTHLQTVLKTKRVFIITDTHLVQHGHADILEESLRADGLTCQRMVVPAGEASKNFHQLESLCAEVLDHQPERGDTIIALGGGVVGDLTGFTASILLRGMRFIQIPTTLLAMVDSSVGGKTGINTRHGKNLIGSFYQPTAVLADTALLATLPPREWRAGYAEIVKYGLIDDAPFFDRLEAQGKQLDITHAIRHSCTAKARIVAEDEREGGKRALLNLGHTFGHALEAEMGFDGRLLHGEAVSIGMVMAFAFSAHLGLSPAADTARLVQHLKAMGLPTHPHDIAPLWPVEKLMPHFYQDKKVANQQLVFILAHGIGDSFIQKNVDATALQNFLHNFLTTGQ